MTVLKLTYRGAGAFRPGLPARDLDHAELAALSVQTKRSIEDIVDEAVGSGLYLATSVPDQDEGSAGNIDEAPAAASVDPLTDPSTTRPVLAAMAAELELTIASRDTKATIVEAIRAERKRLAAEQKRIAAAVDEMAGSGEGDQGGDATPADDSGASATDEAGTPPAEVVTHAQVTATAPFPGPVAITDAEGNPA